MFDPVNAIAGGHNRYTGLTARGGAASLDAAICSAGDDTLSALFPSDNPTFDAFLADDLLAIRGQPQKENGVDAGQSAAAALLAIGNGRRLGNS
jgi:hypothetical protein